MEVPVEVGGRGVRVSAERGSDHALVRADVRGQQVAGELAQSGVVSRAEVRDVAVAVVAVA